MGRLLVIRAKLQPLDRELWAALDGWWFLYPTGARDVFEGASGTFRVRVDGGYAPFRVTVAERPGVRLYPKGTRGRGALEVSTRGSVGWRWGNGFEVPFELLHGGPALALRLEPGPIIGWRDAPPRSTMLDALRESGLWDVTHVGVHHKREVWRWALCADPHSGLHVPYRVMCPRCLGAHVQAVEATLALQDIDMANALAAGLHNPGAP